jgi:hypothetical protein
VTFVDKRRPELGLDYAILDCGELKSYLIHARISCEDFSKLQSSFGDRYLTEPLYQTKRQQAIMSGTNKIT